MASPAARRTARRRLTGIRALVTGGSSGVGRAVAVALARAGARVMATARRQERLAELCGEPAAGAHEPIELLAGDICDPAFRRHLVATTAARLGGIDLVVAAAGSGAIGPFCSAGAETLAEILAVDLVAPAELVRESLPHLARGHDPAVVLVGSILGLHPLPLHGEYCAAKSGLRSLAGTLRLELAADGIDVLLATLGPVESEFWTALVRGRRPRWSRGRGMSPERAARAILGGLERRRPEIVPGWQAKGYAFLARHLPGLIDRWAARNWRQGGEDAARRGEADRDG
ncbi:MAG: SDR family NAD(P)-dependent oxidoreductase [Planctomycetota bacterium]